MGKQAGRGLPGRAISPLLALHPVDATRCTLGIATLAAYSITGALSMQTVADLIGSGFRSEWELVLVMGAIELVLSQVGSTTAQKRTSYMCTGCQRHTRPSTNVDSQLGGDMVGVGPGHRVVAGLCHHRAGPGPDLQ